MKQFEEAVAEVMFFYLGFAFAYFTYIMARNYATSREPKSATRIWLAYLRVIAACGFVSLFVLASADENGKLHALYAWKTFGVLAIAASAGVADANRKDRKGPPPPISYGDDDF